MSATIQSQPDILEKKTFPLEKGEPSIVEEQPDPLLTADKSKLDVAGEFLALHEQSYSEQDAVRVRWAIDLRLVPMLFVTQTLLAIDVSSKTTSIKAESSLTTANWPPENPYFQCRLVWDEEGDSP